MMLLANAPRTTDDVDIFWIEEGEDFHKAHLALRDAAQTIASRYALPLNWFNPQTRIRTRKQAQRALDRYLLPAAQQEEAATIQSALDVLFGSESEREP